MDRKEYNTLMMRLSGASSVLKYVAALSTTGRITQWRIRRAEKLLSKIRLSLEKDFNEA